MIARATAKPEAVDGAIIGVRIVPLLKASIEQATRRLAQFSDFGAVVIWSFGVAARYVLGRHHEHEP